MKMGWMKRADAEVEVEVSVERERGGWREGGGWMLSLKIATSEQGSNRPMETHPETDPIDVGTGEARGGCAG